MPQVGQTPHVGFLQLISLRSSFQPCSITLFCLHHRRKMSPIGVILLAAVTVIVHCVGAMLGDISTIAGNGVAGFAGDGGPASFAALNLPYDVAIDLTGNVYICDRGNSAVRRVTPSGTIFTIAGNGTAGYSGDGGPASSAMLQFPSTVAVWNRSVYVADQNNMRVRMISASGVISTIAGTGVRGYSGDGGLATYATFNYPTGIAFDKAGNLYISDVENNCVRLVTATTRIISTFAGTGSAGYSGDGVPSSTSKLNYPYGIFFDASGTNLYIADDHNGRLRVVTSDGIINTIAGNGFIGFAGDGGSAIQASFSHLAGGSTDLQGNLYLADSGNNRTRRISTGGVVSTVVGNNAAGFAGDGGPAYSALLSAPACAVLDMNGNLYICDSNNNRIRYVAAVSTTSSPSASRTPQSISQTPPTTPSPSATQSWTSTASISPSVTPSETSSPFPLPAANSAIVVLGVMGGSLASFWGHPSVTASLEAGLAAALVGNAGTSAATDATRAVYLVRALDVTTGLGFPARRLASSPNILLMFSVDLSNPTIAAILSASPQSAPVSTLTNLLGNAISVAALWNATLAPAVSQIVQTGDSSGVSSSAVQLVSVTVGPPPSAAPSRVGEIVGIAVACVAVIGAACVAAICSDRAVLSCPAAFWWHPGHLASAQIRSNTRRLEALKKQFSGSAGAICRYCRFIRTYLCSAPPCYVSSLQVQCAQLQHPRKRERNRE